MERTKKQEGFVAITSVLIVSALVLVLGISMFHNSLEDQAMSSAFDKGQEASLLADFCAREAFQNIKQDINYAGDETIEIDGMSCEINPIENISASTKKISTFATVGEQPHYKRQEQEIRYVVESKAADWDCEECEIENLEIVGDSLKLSESLGEGEETEGVTRTISLAVEWTGEGNFYYIIGLETDGDDLILGESQTVGYRISNPFSLNGIEYAGSSIIEWTETIPLDTEINIYTKVVESEGVPAEVPGEEEWELATSSQSIPEIEQGSDMTNHWLWVKQELKTDDISTPRLHSLTETIMQIEIVSVETEGYRISSELDISGEGTVKDSQIFWQVNTRSGASIIIETRFYDGNDWTDWQIAENGREVPDLSRGTDLTAALIQTRATFNGGPEIYPSLNNINIFIEVNK